MEFKFYLELLLNIIKLAVISGGLTTLIIQKIKEGLGTKKFLVLISFVINMIVGTLFAKNFSNLEWIYCVWCGLFGFVGANTIYELLEDKLFKSYSTIQEENIPDLGEK